MKVELNLLPHQQKLLRSAAKKSLLLCGRSWRGQVLHPRRYNPAHAIAGQERDGGRSAVRHPARHALCGD